MCLLFLQHARLPIAFTGEVAGKLARKLLPEIWRESWRWAFPPIFLVQKQHHYDTTDYELRP